MRTTTDSNFKMGIPGAEREMPPLLTLRPPIGTPFVIELQGVLLLLALDTLFLVIAILHHELWILFAIICAASLAILIPKGRNLLRYTHRFALYSDSLDTGVLIRHKNPTISLAELSGIGLVFLSSQMSTGKGVAWWLCYGNARGEIRRIDPMVFGQGMSWSQYSFTRRAVAHLAVGQDDLADSVLGKLAIRIEAQAKLIQGPAGLISVNNPFDELSAHSSEGLLGLHPRSVWTPMQGFRELSAKGMGHNKEWF